MVILKFQLVALLATAILCPSLCVADTAKHNMDADKVTGAQQLPPTSDDPDAWRWVSLPWAPTDPAIVSATAAIDKLGPVSKCTKFRDTVAMTVAQQPNDRLAIYEWAYATNKTNKPAGVGAYDAARYPVMIALQSLSPPYCYEVARMRFIFACTYFPDAHLRSLGARLLARQANDPQVRFYYTEVLATSYRRKPDLETRREMVALGRDFIAAYPDVAKYHALLGWVYITLWEGGGRSKSDGDAALAELGAYLKRSSTDDDFRPTALYWVRIIRGTAVER